MTIIIITKSRKIIKEQYCLLSRTFNQQQFGTFVVFDYNANDDSEGMNSTDSKAECGIAWISETNEGMLTKKKH